MTVFFINNSTAEYLRWHNVLGRSFKCYITVLYNN